MNNLNPCPFCGGNVAYTNDITGKHRIECLACAVLVLFDADLLKEDVIVHWNMRMLPEHLCQHMAQLETSLRLAQAAYLTAAIENLELRAEINKLETQQ